MKPAARAWNGLLIGLTTLFVLNVGLMIAAVATSSFARRWLGTWLPDGTRLHVRSATSARLGEEVRVSFPPQRLLVYPAA